MRPAVSVIVPVYKVEEYIERCARALFGQTMEDLEFIFVDDCTPDASMAILERVMEEYPQRKDQVKILHNEVNSGLPYTRSRGVEIATGEYIIHCDSDDWVEPDMYSKMYSKAKEENLDIVICQTVMEGEGFQHFPSDAMGVDDILGVLITGKMSPSMWNKLITRRAYEKGIVFPKLNMSEDYVTIIQLVFECKSVGYIYERLYHYYMRGDSICHSLSDKSKTLYFKEQLELAISYLEARGLADKYKKEILYAKVTTKSNALPFPRKEYLDFFPELNLVQLFSKDVPFGKRLGHLTHLLGIHGVSKLFKKK